MAHQQLINHHIFDNGLTLVAQSMPWLQSAAFTFGLPAGCRFDPMDKQGLSNLTCEMAFRGGGGYSNRELVEALEGIGCDYYSSTGIYHTFFGGALPAENLIQALEIYLRTIGGADLAESQFEDGRNVCLQEVYGLEDDLAGKAMLELRLRHYGHPFGRNSDGDVQGLESATIDDVRAYFRRYYQPHGAIMAVAGNCDWEKLKAHVERITADMKPDPVEMPKAADEKRGYYHIPFESNQTHLTFAWPWLPYRDDQYYLARAAIGVLSDGMSSRLFHEVREKRGLCYAVSANCHSILDRGAVFGYSGTTTQSAQETMNVFLAEVRGLAHGVRKDELDRLKVQFRSGLIMQQESCRSRVSAIAGDMFHLGRVRMLDEINEKINSLTVERVNQFLAEHVPGPFDIVTLGESELEVNDEFASA